MVRVEPAPIHAARVVILERPSQGLYVGEFYVAYELHELRGLNAKLFLIITLFVGKELPSLLHLGNLLILGIVDLLLVDLSQLLLEVLLELL